MLVSSLSLQSEHFPFLSVTHSNLDLRCRTVFYIALGRLLLVELGEDEEKFERFISPMTGMYTLHVCTYDIVYTVLSALYLLYSGKLW